MLSEYLIQILNSIYYLMNNFKAYFTESYNIRNELYFQYWIIPIIMISFIVFKKTLKIFNSLRRI